MKSAKTNSKLRQLDECKCALFKIKNNNGNACGIIVAIDRQEKGGGDISATQDISHKLNIPILSIITLDNIIEYLASQNTLKKELKSIEKYQKEYGVS